MNNTSNSLVSGIDPASFSAVTGPSQDLFRFVNGPWVDMYRLPDDRSRYGSFDKLAEDAENQIRDILEEDDCPAVKSRALYHSFLDVDAIDAAGLAAIEDQLASIDEAEDKAALTRALNSYGKKSGILKEGDSISGEDSREGITAVISVKLSDAQFEGQTKTKLGNSDIRSLVDSVVREGMMTYLEEHPAAGKAIIEKSLMASRAREAARKAREATRRKSVLESGSLPDKLQDCNERDPSLCEIYIVEGDSAAGSAIQGRDSRFQAILAMWGKMLNVEKARADKIYGNDKLSPVIMALGAGIGSEFNIDKLRYHKIIIMADADVDGAHIRTLLLTFFFRYMRPLIEKGYVYSAVPPLYKLTRGKTQRVAYSDEQRDQISAELRGDNPNTKINISRFKGLGEMDAHELWETTMDPERRTLRRITLDDAIEADQVFTVLMGEQVEPRKQWIERNAKYAVNIDI